MTSRQLALFGHEASGFDPEFRRARRIALAHGAWVEYVPGWLEGHAELFETLLHTTAWRTGEQRMYDRNVETPRMFASLPKDGPGHPKLRAMRDALSARYGEAFERLSLALYRDGRDSVAWHGDRIPLDIVDPIVAILSLGSSRTLRMREKAAHANARAFTLEPGDLFVMGGNSQRTWEHSVPKTARAGPRMSLQFRHSSNDSATSGASTASDAT